MSQKKVFTTIISLFMVGSLISLGISSNVTAYFYPWTEEEPLPLATEQAAVAANATGMVFIFGGINEKSGAVVNKSWMYDPHTGLYTSLPDMPVGVRGGAVAIGHYGEIAIFGGVNSSGQFTNAVQRYQPSSQNWHISYSLPDPVWQARAVYVESIGRFLVVGGTTPSGTSDLVQLFTVAYVSVGNLTGPGKLPVARAAGGLCLNPDGSKVWYFGGVDSTYSATNFVYEFNCDLSSPAWTYAFAIPYACAGMGVVRGLDGLYHVFGGGPNHMSTASGFADYYIFDPYLWVWYSPQDMSAATKYFGGVATVDGRIWAFGGCNNIVLDTVQSVKIWDYSIGAPTMAQRGDPFLVNISLDSQAVSYHHFEVEANIIGPDGMTYGYVNASTSYEAPLAFEMTVPSAAENGSYWINIYAVRAYRSESYWTAVPGKQLRLAITNPPEASDQLAEMQTMIEALNDQIDQLRAELNASEGQNNISFSLTQAQMALLNAQIDVLQTELNMTSVQGNETAAEMQVQIDMLRAQLNVSNAQAQADRDRQTEILTDALNGKADGTLVFALICLVIVVLAMIMLVFLAVRKKT